MFAIHKQIVSDVLFFVLLLHFLYKVVPLKKEQFAKIFPSPKNIQTAEVDSKAVKSLQYNSSARYHDDSKAVKSSLGSFGVFGSFKTGEEGRPRAD